MRTLNPQAYAKARGRLLDAARRVFAAKGYHAASMNDVARAAGVAKAAMYHYFDGKHGMLEALHTDLWSEGAARLKAAPPARDLREALWVVGGEYLAHFQEPRHAELMRIAFNISVVEPELLRLSSGVIMPRMQELLIGYFGPCFPKGTPPQAIMLHVLPFVGGLFYYLFVMRATCPLDQLPAEPEEYLAHLVDVFSALPAPADKKPLRAALSKGRPRSHAPAAPRRRTRGPE